MAVVTEDFPTGAAFKHSITDNAAGVNVTAAMTILQKNATTSFQNMSNSECIRAYGKTYVTDRRDVLVVTSVQINASIGSVRHAQSNDAQPRNNWVCDDTQELGCDIARAVGNASSWTVNKMPVAYCLSMQTPQVCRFEFSLQLLVVVVICNLVKALCMALTVWKQKTPTLVTIGDAVASFLDSPDPTTVERCMMTKADVLNAHWYKKHISNGQADFVAPSATEWLPKHNHWFSAASVPRWVTCISLFVGVLAYCWYLC